MLSSRNHDVDGQPQIEVKATAGNKLGGDDFDEVLIDYLVAETRSRLESILRRMSRR